ncbi:pol [Symbiodinium sp. CCMP2456]|nr:pol [Symbiodinium sp. CCMP2456]
MAVTGDEMMPQSQAEIMDVFGGCLPAVAQSLQGMKQRQQDKEKGDHQDNKRPRKEEGPEASARPKTGPPRRGQQRRGNPSFGTSSSGLERLVANMASLCLRQEEELQLMRVDKQFLIHFSSGPQGLLPSLYAVAQKWNEAKEKSPPEVKNSLRGDDLFWPYKKWDGQQLVLDTAREPVAHQIMLETVAELKQIFLSETEQLVHKFRSTRPLTAQIAGGALPFLLSLSCRGQVADQAHAKCNILCGSTALQLIGANMRAERAKRSPAANALAKDLDQLRATLQN